MITFRSKLIATQVYIHIAFVIGLLALPLYIAIPAIVVQHIIFSGICGSVFYHRVVTHRNKIGKNMESVLLLVSILGASASAIAWAGQHRKHHRYSDTDKDPHNPALRGKLRSYWQMSDDNSSIARYVPDLLRSSMYTFQHKHYFSILASAHIIGLLTLPLQIYWIVLVVPGFVMWFSGSMVNAFGHKQQQPANNIILGVLLLGEGFHANHHEQPANPDFRHRFDLGHKLYRLLI